MVAGVPLTPQQVAKAAQVYADTGNYSEAARAIGVDESAVRRTLKRLHEPKRAELHARACANGERRMRRYMVAAGNMIHRLLQCETKDGISLEPRDVSSLVNSLSKLSDSLLSVGQRIDQRKQAALTRAKTRAEIIAISAEDDSDAETPTTVIIAFRAEAADPAPVEPNKTPA